MYLAHKYNYKKPPAITIGRKVVLISDISQDPDDYAALGVLCRLHQIGQVEIIGVVSESADDYGPSCAKAILEFYNLPSVPVAAYQQGTTVTSTTSTSVRNQFKPGEVRTDYPDCLLLREWLENNSGVVIINTGGARALSRVLLSSADIYSNKSGAVLLSNVEYYVFMGGTYPSGSETNFNISTNLWPAVLAINRPKYFVGSEVGETIYSGPPASASATSNPIKNAFISYGLATRKSWDPCAVLVLSAEKDYYTWVSGELRYTAGSNDFLEHIVSCNAYAVKKLSDSNFETDLSALLA